MIGVYFETWSCPWANSAADLALAKIAKPIDQVYLSFVNPNCSYKKGQCTWNGTGLNFSSDFKIVKEAISILQNQGIKVILAIGGASYSFSPYYPQNCADLMMDLGCDGVDLDWEPADGFKSANKLGNIISITRQAIGKKFLSLAGFSTGCLDPNGDTYRGMNIQGIRECGQLLDQINVMAYDAGRGFDTKAAYDAFRKYFSKSLALGFEVGKQGWGDAWLTMEDVKASCQWLKDGCFVWAYFKAGPPSAVEVCQTVAQILNVEQTKFNCPHCKQTITVSK